MKSERPTVVIGGGVSGLGTAWQMMKRGLGPVIVLEKAPKIGGLCSTISCMGHRADIGPHKIFSLLPDVVPEILSLFAAEEIIRHEKRNRLYLFGSYLDYPLRIGNLLGAVGPVEAARMGLSYAASVAGGCFRRKEETTYEQYVIQRFGRRIYKQVFFPLANKVWGDPSTLSSDIARTRIPASGGMDIVLKILRLKREQESSNARFFHYPVHGFGEIPRKMAADVERRGGTIHVNAADVSLHVSNGAVEEVSWRTGDSSIRIPVASVVWTAPLASLPDAISGRDTTDLRTLTGRLRSRNVIVVYLAFRSPSLTNDHWIFTPDPAIGFNRLYEPRQLSSVLSPDGQTIIACDMTSHGDQQPWTLDNAQLERMCLEGLEAMGIVHDRNLLIGSCVTRSESFYPRYSGDYRATMQSVLDATSTIPNLLLTGRQGLYNYNNLDHCVWMAMESAAMLEQKRPIPAINHHLLESSQNFRIVD